MQFHRQPSFGRSNGTFNESLSVAPSVTECQIPKYMSSENVSHQNHHVSNWLSLSIVFVWHQKQFSPSCECLQNQLEPWACSGIEAEGWSREKSEMTIIIRRRVMRVDLDERSNILGGLFNPPSGESTPRAANTRTLPLFRHQFSNVWLFCPIFFHCVTVLPQFVNDLSSRLHTHQVFWLGNWLPPP